MMHALALLAWIAADVEVPAAATPPAPAPPIVLDWQAPASCPDGAAVQERVRSLIGANPRSRLPGTLHAEGNIYPSANGRWQLDLRTRVGELEGERRLSAEDCVQLSQVASLVLAVIINPEAGSLPVTVALPPPPPPAPPPPPPPQSGKLAIGMETRLATGHLPSLAGGLGARVAYLGSRVGLQAHADWFQTRGESSPAQPTSGGEFHLFQAAAWGCALTLPGPRARGEGCLGLGVNRLRGVGMGIANPKATAAWWPSVGLELALRARLFWRVDGRVFLENSLSFRRPRFAIDAVGLVYQPRMWNLSLGTGLSLQF